MILEPHLGSAVVGVPDAVELNGDVALTTAIESGRRDRHQRDANRSGERGARALDLVDGADEVTQRIEPTVEQQGGRGHCLHHQRAGFTQRHPGRGWSHARGQGRFDRPHQLRRGRRLRRPLYDPLRDEQGSGGRAWRLRGTRLQGLWDPGQHRLIPGQIDTPTSWSVGVDPRSSTSSPVPRNGEPDDVAQAVLYLASDESAWVTGTTLEVDGGMNAGPLL